MFIQLEGRGGRVEARARRGRAVAARTLGFHGHGDNDMKTVKSIIFLLCILRTKND